MIPLRHTLQLQRTSWVTEALVGANVVVFLSQVFIPRLSQVYVSLFSFIPARLFFPHGFEYSQLQATLTLFTSLFIHGGFMHIAGNMLYLWVFGRSVEERLGSGPFLALYLLSGILGSLTHAFLFSLSAVPSIGASGCVAGVLGAFLVLFPRARVITLFPLIVYWGLAEIPAVILLPLWFLLQFFNGWMSVSSSVTVQEMAGVAWWAHVGGFTFGMLVGWWSRERVQKAELKVQK